MNIRKKIRLARQLNNITQKQLGFEIGYSEGHISNMESGGRKLKVSDVEKIEEFLQVDIINKEILKEELPDWKLIYKEMGGGGLTYFNKKEIRIDIRHRNDFALFLHELAHAVSGKKHYQNDGILMDTMTNLVRKYCKKNDL